MLYSDELLSRHLKEVVDQKTVLKLLSVN